MEHSPVRRNLAGVSRFDCGNGRARYDHSTGVLCVGSVGQVLDQPEPNKKGPRSKQPPDVRFGEPRSATKAEANTKREYGLI